MKIHLRPTASLLPYEANPRINDAAVDAVAASIQQFGFRQPIVIDAAGVIVCGHTRWKAAQKLGLEKVPVHIADDLTADQIRALRLADNQTSDLSDWDYELLPLELEALQAVNYDLGLLGFSPDELIQIMGDALEQGQTDPDHVPGPPAAARTQPGDLFALGDHRLLCGDSSLPADLDRLLAGQPIHLVNTDPPYNVAAEPRSNAAIAGGQSSFPASNKSTAETLRPRDRAIENDAHSAADYAAMLTAWFGNLARVLLPGRGYYIWGGFSNVMNYPQALVAAELYFSQTIIWVKDHPVLTRKDFMTNHEWAFYGWREGAAHQYFGPTNCTDVWRIRRGGSDGASIGRGLRLESADGCRLDVSPPTAAHLPLMPVPDDGLTLYGPGNATDVWSVKKVPGQSMVHLTEKPVELAVKAIQYSSRPGENVLDLFGGSGSTLIAAQQTGRRAYLMELDPLYCDVIIQRFEEFTGLKAEKLSAVSRDPQGSAKPAKNSPAAKTTTKDKTKTTTTPRKKRTAAASR